MVSLSALRNFFDLFSGSGRRPKGFEGVGSSPIDIISVTVMRESGVVDTRRLLKKLTSRVQGNGNVSTVVNK